MYKRSILALLLLLLLSLPLMGVKRKVTFRYQPMIGGVGKVYLSGSFNSWNPNNEKYRMKESGGIYTITIFLEPGKYMYKFVIDGTKWITDPNAKETAPDGFGGKNGIIVVKATDASVILKPGDGKVFKPGIDHQTKLPYVKPLDEKRSRLAVRLQVANKDTEKAWLHVDRGQGAFRVLPMTLDKELTQGDSAYYTATLTGLSPASKLRYFFRVKDGTTLLYLSGKRFANNEAQAKAQAFTLLVEDIKVFRTPDWVKNGIMYQIFPERFYNGKPSNDPDLSEKDLYYTTPRPESPKTRVPEVLNPGNPEYYHVVKQWNRVYYLGNKFNSQRYFTFYGGDLIGVEKKLPYLKDLGVTIIYFNPIFRAKSNHKYDAVDFLVPDPHFGTVAEVKRFVQKAHSMGIRIIIDSSFNHTGDKHYAFQDTYTYGEKSKYWKWYEWKKWPVPKKITGKISDYYNCWWGFGSLPDLNFDLKATGSAENPKTDIYLQKSGKYYKMKGVQRVGKKWVMQYDQRATSPVGQYILAQDVNWELVHHLFDTAWFWTRTMDIDGWRLDVANEVPFWFWKLFRQVVKTAKKDAYLVGEIWSAANVWLGGDYFDAVMNYKYFKDPVLKFLGKGQGSAAQFDAELKPARVDYPKQAQYAQMNLLGSHDTHRYLSAINDSYPRFMLTFVFGMTYIGAPQIYYGDEIGMQGGKDPDCRRTFYWDYPKHPHRVKLHHWIRKLARIRHKYSALRTGSYRTVYTEGKVIGFTRWDKQHRLLVVLNSSDKAATATLDASACGLKNGDRLQDLIFGDSYQVRGGKLDVPLLKISGRILVRR